ncbi:hypothetical protein CPB85DRAFT_1459478 [Mucidula mucida]|nr:hypothetical protein CPB85DRAFT_1459478 [Mucidula mucida]
MQGSFSADRELHDELVSYVSTEHLAVSVCLMLIICGVPGASRLSIFSPFLEPNLWMVVRQKLLDELQAETSRDLYDRYRKGYNGNRHDVAGISDFPMAYHSYEELVLIVSQAEVAVRDPLLAPTPYQKVPSESSTFTGAAAVHPTWSVHLRMRAILTGAQADETAGSSAKEIV